MKKAKKQHSTTRRVVNSREIRGSMTRQELAEVLSIGTGRVSKRSVENWELGKRKPSGTSESLLCLVQMILEKGKVTREELIGDIVLMEDIGDDLTRGLVGL